MSNEAEILPNLLREESFEIVMRGYNRRQVDEYIARTRNQIRELEARLSRALDEVERTRREMNEVREARRPTGDELGDRLRQIINLAEEEAKSKLGDADKKVNQIREDADGEAKRLVEEAQERSEHAVAAAQEKAGQLASTAKQEADKVLTAAKHEAEQTVNNARAEAERTLTTAQRRSSVINEGATDRLASLTKQHAQALGRLGEISETLAALLQGEEKAGPLEQMISEAVSAPPEPRQQQPVAKPKPEAPNGGPQQPPRIIQVPAAEDMTD